MSNGKAHSAIFDRATRQRKQCRDDYQDALYTEYTRADEACRGRLLNREGERRGIDSESLFYGNQTRADKYASEELKDYWRAHPRTTFEEFEEQWIEYN